MSGNTNTEATHVRFWARMTELYGRKWVEEYGAEVPVSWRELVDKYTPRELKAGIDRLRMRSSQYVPTQPEVAQILEAAQAQGRNTANDPTELRRGYWRSCIIEQVARNLGYTGDSLEHIVIANKSSLGRAMKDLLDEVDDSEIRTGQRTKGMHDMVLDGCQRIAIAFNSLKAAA
jgi:hypothetical protein